MKLIYPCKNFTKAAHQILNARQELVIHIGGGWRGRILAREVSLWPKIADISQLDRVNVKPPSARSMWLLAPLIGIYHMALAAEYKLNVQVKEDEIDLILTPLDSPI